MNTRRIALIAMLSALTLVVAYAKGVSLALPGVVEFMTVMVFVSGYCFGLVVGGFVGFVSLVLYMLIPSPFAHPAAWMFSISPLLLFVMGLLGMMYGVVGGVSGRSRNSSKITAKFVAEMAFFGFVLTFA